MSITCLKCGAEAPDGDTDCLRCGANFAKLQALAERGEFIRPVVPPTAEQRQAAADAARATRPLTAAEQLQRARTSGDWTNVPADLVQKHAALVILSTVDSVPGRAIQRACGIVAAEHAFAFGALEEAAQGLVRNVIGSGRSPQMALHLASARQQVLHELRYAALNAGANAVVGVRVDFEEFSGANSRGTLVAVATGTGVWVDE